MWKIIRLELARTPEFPYGRNDCGYEIIAPVDPTGHLDVDTWRANRDDAAVRRFWRDEDDQSGQLIHTRHGTWAISYRPGEDDDEPFFRLEGHRLAEGEYVTITEHGVARPFHIVSARALRAPAVKAASLRDPRL